MQSPADTTMTTDHKAIVRQSGLIDYSVCWNAMREFTRRRTPTTQDELWLLQHPPVYTTGFRFPSASYDIPDDIPVIHTDRGGDITYHGPGQLVAYVLMDLHRRAWGVKQLVTALEKTVLNFLNDHGVEGHRRPGAPGVYVKERKIAALGLRIRHGCSYHGIAINIDMDLSPFTHIDICGYPGMQATQLAEFGIKPELTTAQHQLTVTLQRELRYNSAVELTRGHDLLGQK